MKNILLSYVGFPTTTAYYFERALKERYSVITIGPSIEQDHIDYLDINLPEMKLDIQTPKEFDMLEIFDKFNNHNLSPDLFLWIESASRFEPKNVDKLNIPTACYFIDTHLHLKIHLEWARNFNQVFVAQKEYIKDFQEHGIQNVHWLPLGCDPEIHTKHDVEKDREIGFVGSFVNNPRRNNLIDNLKTKFDVKIKRCFYEEMAKEFSKSKIVFNNAVKRDLNMRVFEALSIGSFLLTDEAPNSGLTEIFKSNEDLTIYNDSYIKQSASFYLENDELREKIALRGREMALNAHKYSDRCEEILNITLGSQTETPTASDWRERSLKNCSVTSSEINKLKRSFVIPVLDYSPASQYNITTLLNDLENIEGNVIVVFNNESVADELKYHKRIDYYAVMSHNVGVARAWNIGLDMSQTPITFILNADLHINRESVEILESALIQLPDAGCVGPQGSYFNFFKAEDHQYFEKGSFTTPVQVDAVSGFYFAVKTKYFHDGLVKFENKYTPCWFEEWDTAWQMKRHNIKSYIVPTNGFDHQFGGSIKATEAITYFNKKEFKTEIINRNTQIFMKKWMDYNQKSENEGRVDFLISELIIQHINSLYEMELVDSNKISEGLEPIFQQYQNLSLPLFILAKKSYQSKQFEIAKRFLEKVLEIEPSFKPALELLETIK